MANLYIIAGSNGAGKTTASYTALPEMLNCREFVNADEIARGLSPFQPQTVDFQAGRIMLRRINELLRGKNDFGFETTLSTKSYIHLIRQAKSLGYRVILIFFWLESPELAKARVKARVAAGGHDIPGSVIERRYYRGIKNLFTLYLERVDSWAVYDNSGDVPVLVAQRNGALKQKVFIDDLWKKIQTYR